MRALQFLLKLIFHTLLVAIASKQVVSENVSKGVENSKLNNGKRPSFLIPNKNNVLTPNYSVEINCFGPPTYFYDVVNRKIMSLDVACKDTYLLINSNGELVVRLTDETFHVNDRRSTKYFFFDRSSRPSEFVLKEYGDLAEIQHKPNELIGNNFNEIPADYNTREDGEYLSWITKVEFLGANTISGSMVQLSNKSLYQQENKFEMNIPVKEKLFLVFIIRTHFIGTQNTYFGAFPIFFLSNIKYDVRKPQLNIDFQQIGSENIEIYDIKRGVHHYRGLKLKINKIHGEHIIFSESLFELEKKMSDRFDQLKIELDSEHNLGISDILESVNNIDEDNILSSEHLQDPCEVTNDTLSENATSSLTNNTDNTSV
ncbi:putative signal peptide-containing protein [Cryptosporidium canis]|uniref:Signal peptide-containing protein n=1 Tax=Cryptosporidium canis TaxID=195482 RepID=A0ABQ8P2F7_9CRYT|nr:putative signal peptide-containing protein [Cryptosporidium canis]